MPVQERPGYTVKTVPAEAYEHQPGPEQGRQVLRASWMNRSDLKRLQRAARQYDPDNDETAGGFYAVLGDLIAEWDFVDRKGQPLPQPAEGAAAFEQLDIETEMWLAGFDEGQLFGDVIPKKARRVLLSATSSSPTTAHPATS